MNFLWKLGRAVFNCTMEWTLRLAKGFWKLQSYFVDKIRSQLPEIVRNGEFTLEVVVSRVLVNVNDQRQGMIRRLLQDLKPAFLFFRFIIFKSISFIHQQRNKKQLQFEHFVENLKEIYEDKMSDILSKNLFCEEHELLTHHLLSKSNIMSSFDALEESVGMMAKLQEIKNLLLRDVDDLFNEIKREQASEIDKEMKEAIALLNPLQQAHLMNLKEKSYEVETQMEFNQFHEQEKTRLLKQLRITSGIPVSSSWFDSLSKKLTQKLGTAKATVCRAWNSKITAGLTEVEKVYMKLLNEEISKEDGNKLLNSPRSLESHQKFCDASILKCIQQKLAPPFRRFMAESRQLLDNGYEQSISEMKCSSPVIGIHLRNYTCFTFAYLNGKFVGIPNEYECLKPHEMEHLKIFKKVRATAVNYLNQEVTKCVVVVEYFSDSNFFKNDEKRIESSCKTAGFDKVIIIHEQGAASLTLLQMKRSWNEKKYVLLLDFNRFYYYLYQVCNVEAKKMAVTRSNGVDSFQYMLAEYCGHEFIKELNGSMGQLTWTDFSIPLQSELEKVCGKAVVPLLSFNTPNITVSFPNFHNGKDLSVECDIETIKKLRTKLYTSIAKNLKTELLWKNYIPTNSVIEVILTGNSAKAFSNLEEFLKGKFGARFNISKLAPDDTFVFGAMKNAMSILQ